MQTSVRQRMQGLVAALPSPAGVLPSAFTNAITHDRGDKPGRAADDALGKFFATPTPSAGSPPLARSVQGYLASTSEGGQPGLSDESLQLVLARLHSAVESSNRRPPAQQPHSVDGRSHGDAASPGSGLHGDLFHAWTAGAPKRRRGAGDSDGSDGGDSVSSMLAAGAAEHDEMTGLNEEVPGTALLLALATGRVSELRFNEGAFMLDGGMSSGVDAGVMATRIASLITTAPDYEVLRAFQHDIRLGGLPLRLLQPIAPQLRSMMFQRALLGSANNPACDRPLHRIMFDGMHISLPGLAAALVAWNDGDDVVTVPPSYTVLMAPVGVMDGEGGSQPCHKASKEDLGGLIHSRKAPLHFMLDRWPHLPFIFDAAPPHAVQEARAFLQGLYNVYAADADDIGFTACVPHDLSNLPLVPSVPRTLVALQREHAERASVAMVSFVLGANCRAVQWVGYNSRLVELMGMQDWPIEQLISTPRPPGAPQPRWLHPSCLMRRALAYLSASNIGAASFQVEAQFMRCSPPAKVTGGVQTPPFTPYLDGWTASSFYAVETVHYERYHNGLPMARTSYISDVIPVHGSTPLHELEASMVDAQLSSIEDMILCEPNLPLEVAIAVRRTGLPPSVALKASGLDTENERILVRMFLLAAGGHGLLGGTRQSSQEDCTSSVLGGNLAGDAASSSASESVASDALSDGGTPDPFEGLRGLQAGIATCRATVVPDALEQRRLDANARLAQRSMRAASKLAGGLPKGKVEQNARDLVYILSGKQDPDGLAVTVGTKQLQLPSVSAAAEHMLKNILDSFRGEGAGFSFDEIAKLELLSVPFA